MNDKPNRELGIHRMTHGMILGGKRFVCTSDMIVIDDIPYAVLEWEGPQENQHPGIKVELDWGKLSPPDSEGYVVYDGDVIDPRSVQ